MPEPITQISKIHVILKRMKNPPLGQRIYRFFEGDCLAISNEQKCEILKILQEDYVKTVSWIESQI